MYAIACIYVLTCIFHHLVWHSSNLFMHMSKVQALPYSRPRTFLSLTLLKINNNNIDFLFVLCLEFYILTVECFPYHWLLSCFLTSAFFMHHINFLYFILLSFHNIYIFSFLLISVLFFFFLSSTVFQTLAGNRKSVYKHMLTKKHIGQCADVKSG